jgi:hypothetical protein
MVASTKARVSVATPERCLSTFNTVRSAARSARARPRTVRTRAPGLTVSPSVKSGSTAAAESSIRKTGSAKPTPASTPSCFATTSATACLSAGTTAAAVRSCAAPSSSSAARRNARWGATSSVRSSGELSGVTAAS